MTPDRLMRQAFAGARIVAAAAALAGCSGVLPKKHEVEVASFTTFDQAHAAFGKVIVGQTTLAEMRTIGFDPDRTPNVQQINYLQVLQVFLPRQDMPFSTVPPSVQKCIEAQTRCTGYLIDPKVTNQKRTGSIFLDFFNFRRKTETTGWTANAIFVLLDDIVVYKLWSGEPNVDTTSTNINPLGPVQDLGAGLSRLAPTPNY